MLSGVWEWVVTILVQPACRTPRIPYESSACCVLILLCTKLGSPLPQSTAGEGAGDSFQNIIADRADPREPSGELRCDFSLKKYLARSQASFPTGNQSRSPGAPA